MSRKANPELKESDLRVTGLSKEVLRKLNNAAKNYGVTLTSFMKPHLRNLADSLPEHITRDIVD